MTDPQPTKPARSTLNRRKFLATAGAGVAGSSLLTMLDTRQAPAQIALSRASLQSIRAVRDEGHARDRLPPGTPPAF